MIRFAFVIIALSCIISHVNSFSVQYEIPPKDALSEQVSPNINSDLESKRRHAYNKIKRQLSKFDNQVTESNDMSLKNTVKSINSGLSNILKDVKTYNRSYVLEKYANQIIDYLKGNTIMRRAADRYDIKPKFVSYSEAKRPVMKFELNAHTIGKVINDVIKSDLFQKNFEKVVKHATVLYRTVQQQANGEVD